MVFTCPAFQRIFTLVFQSFSITLHSRRAPTAHTNPQSKRLAQETFTGLHGTILLDLELEEAEDSSAHDEKFHLSHIAADTSPRTVAERDECSLLAGSETLGAPALGDELLCVRTPDLLGAVDGVARDGEDVARAEGVARDDDGAGAGGDLTGQTHGGGGVDAHGLPDDPLQVLDILDHGVGWDVNVLGDALVQGLLQLAHHAGGALAPVQDGAGSVGGGVGAGDQLGEGLSGEFLATESVAVLVLAFHQAGEQVDTGVVGHDLGLDTLVDTGDSDTSQVLDSLHTLGEELVGDVLGEGNQPGHAAQGCRDFTAAVEDLDSLDILGGVVGVQAHLRNVLALLEHAKGSTESQVADDVESQVVKPVESVQAGVASLGVGLEVGHLSPLLDEHLDVAMDVLLELANRLGAEGVRDNLALARVLGTVARVEETAADRDESIIEVTGSISMEALIGHLVAPRPNQYIRLQEAIAVSVDGGDCLVIGDRDMTRRNAHKLSILLVSGID